MSSLYKLITKTNLKSPTLAFPLIMPLIFVLLYSVGIDPGQSQTEVDALVATFFVTILAVTTMQSGLMGFGINFISIKKSVLLRRIGATELSKMDVIMAVLLFGLTLWVISVIWIFGSVVIFSALGVFYSAAGDHIVSGGIVSTTTESSVATAFGWISHVNWLKIMVATIVMLIPSYGLGLFVTSISKDDQMYMGIAMLYFFFAGFVGGIMFPGEMPTWMNYVGYLVPHSYIGNFYDWAAGATIGFWGMGQTASLVVSAAIPLAFGVVITGAAAKLLKFD